MFVVRLALACALVATASFEPATTSSMQTHPASLYAPTHVHDLVGAEAPLAAARATESRTQPGRGLLDCADNTIYGQEPSESADPGFNVSLSDWGAGSLAFEWAEGVVAEVAAIQWWGFMMECCWFPCTAAPLDFEITFYEGGGPEPGPAVYTLVVTVNPEPTGAFYSYGGPVDHELYHFSAAIDPPCAVKSPWVSITRLGGDPTCVFMWISSPDGDAYSLQYQVGAGLYTDQPFDLAYCLTGSGSVPTGACCLPSGCSPLPEDKCSAAGGIFIGPGIDCMPGLCEGGAQPGACCTPTGDCIESVPGLACAVELGGVFMGYGLECTPGLCGPEPTILVADRPECTDFDLPTTGAGLGRSPAIDQVGRVTDQPVTGVSEVPRGGATIPATAPADGRSRPLTGEGGPASEVSPPRQREVVGPPEPPRPPRRRPPPPQRRECVPPTPPSMAEITSSPIYRMLSALAGRHDGRGSASINAVDLGLGVGWNPSIAAMTFDVSTGRYVLIGKDSAVTTFTFDGAGNWVPSTGGEYALEVNPPQILARHNSGTVYEFVQGTPQVPLPGVPYLLQSVTDRNGNSNTYEWEAGNLVRMTDAHGREINLTHYPDGHIQTITDAVGRQVGYEYVGSNLTAIVLPNGDRIEYTYNSDHLMTSKTVPDGGVYQIEYAADGITLRDPLAQPFLTVQGVSTVDTAASVSSGELTLMSGQVPVLDGEGAVWQYDYDARGQVTRVVSPLLEEIQIGRDAATRNISSILDCRGHLTTYEYDAAGNLTRVTDAAGYVTEMEYHPEFALITRLVEPDGDEWLYLRDAHGNLETVIDPLIEVPDDQVLRYEYDAEGRLITSIDENGNEMIYGYTAGLQTSITVDPGGLNLTTSFEYDAMGRLTALVDANGVRTEYGVDEFNRVTDIVVDAGAAVHLNLHTVRVHDESGNLVSEVDPRGVTTTYEYDERDRLRVVIRDDGGLALTTLYEYDGCDRLLYQADHLGHITGFVYEPDGRLHQVHDALGQITTYEYDCVGNLTRVVDHDGRETIYEYDLLNRRMAETVDPHGLALTTTFHYVSGSCGCGTPGSALVHAVVDPDGFVTYTYYDELDRPTAIVRKFGDTDDNGGDADDAITRVVYDGVGNATRITVENAPHPDQVAAFMFDAAGRQTARILDPDHAALTVTWEYDNVGNVIVEHEPSGNVGTYAWDAANRLVSVTDSIGQVVTYTYDENGNPLSVTDANGHGLAYRYDALNRRTHEWDADGQVTTYSYDPLSRLITRTDRLGRVTSFTYDPLGQKLAETTPLTAPPPTTQYTYDAAGRVLTITDGNGRTTGYTYDGAGRLVEEAYADGTARTFAYDGRGNIAARTDASATVTTYAYDDLNRLVARAYTIAADSPVADTPPATFAYDRAGNMLSADTADADLEFSYDGAGRVIAMTQNGHTTTVGYGSTATGLQRQVTYPGGRVVLEQRQLRGGLAEVSDNGVPVVTFDFDEAGRILGRSHPVPGATSAYDYTNNLWVTGITHNNAGGAFVQLAYGRDLEGNPTHVRKAHDPDSSELYSYDGADRLTGFGRGRLNASGDELLSYSPLSGLHQEQIWEDLDPVGNWRSQVLRSDNEVTTEERGVSVVNAYTNIGPRGLLHDASGNLRLDGALGDTNFDGVIDHLDLQVLAACMAGPCDVPDCTPPTYDPFCGLVDFDADGDVDLHDFAQLQWAQLGLGGDLPGARTYTYDAENRLVAVHLGGELVASYAYDALHRRVRKNMPSAVTQYIYDDHYRVLEERDADEVVTAEYVYAEWIDDAVLMHRGEQTYYFHRDVVGSVVAVTDEAGLVVEQYAYDAYGRPLVRDADGVVLDGSAIGNPYMFTGRRYEPEIGCYYFRARFFDPQRGRFLQRDPLGLAAGTNLYQYVSSQPTVSVDPLGLIEPGFERCFGKTWTLASGSRRGSVGPVSWSASFSATVGGEVCVKCCPEGTPRAYSWVIDYRLQARISGSASASGSSFGGEVGPIGFWAGVRVTASISGSASGRAFSDYCNNVALRIRICAQATGTLRVSGGAEAWVGPISVGATLTGQGQINARKCLVCSPAGCQWEPGEVCISGSVELRAYAFWVIDATFTIWSGRTCFGI
jgi:RHS repeat-associated protein